MHSSILSTHTLFRHVRRAAIVLAVALVVTACATVAETQVRPGAVTRVSVTFSGGHETAEVDHGRPVVLIAAALGVTPDVFRDAFSHVHPAGVGSGGPTDAEARQNKAALLQALGPYGVTDERLNAVSDFYRYPPGYGGLWKTTPAIATALVKDGAVISYEIISGGAGYTTPPTVAVPGIAGAAAPNVEVIFGKDMKHNGSITAIVLPSGPKK